MTIDEIKKALKDAFVLQEQAVIDWHAKEPQFSDEAPEATDLAALAELLQRQHAANFGLWHVEDTARRRDVQPERIAECKHVIDSLNQKRNDLIEKIDLCLLALLAPLLPAESAPRHNTETIGSAVDRLSILALKLYHMDEQTRRTRVTREHIEECRRKLGILQAQRQDLIRSVLELLDDYTLGAKRPKVYYQFKMYNDPRLNPELYSEK